MSGHTLAAKIPAVARDRGVVNRAVRSDWKKLGGT